MGAVTDSAAPEAAAPSPSRRPVTDLPADVPGADVPGDNLPSDDLPSHDLPSDGSPIEKVADSVPPTAVRTSRRLWQWTARVIALAAGAITVMVIALSIGMRANDAEIDDHLGTATATVLSLSPLRTGVEFIDITGATIRPEGGVLYPGLLALGQQFVVEYSTQDPQIARVAGRTAAVGTPLIALTQTLTILIAVPLIWWCLRRAGLPLIGLRRGPGRVGPELVAPQSSHRSPHSAGAVEPSKPG